MTDDGLTDGEMCSNRRDRVRCKTRFRLTTRPIYTGKVNERIIYAVASACGAVQCVVIMNCVITGEGCIGGA